MFEKSQLAKLIEFDEPSAENQKTTSLYLGAPEQRRVKAELARLNGSLKGRVALEGAAVQLSFLDLPLAEQPVA